MTVLVPLNHFDKSHAVRRTWKPALDRDRLTGIVVTIAVHGLILVAALTAVHVSHTKVMQELSVQITPQKVELAKDVAPTPKLVQPTIVTVPPPEVVVQTSVPPPIAVQQAVSRPVAPAPVAAPQKAAGETRDSFLGRLLAQLNRFKQYPRSARQAHIEGVVMLHFVMDANGRVTSYEIAKSSGRPVLDAEALALIQRAQPLPSIPADFPTRTLDAVVPIEFSLNA
ncbi:MAG TPA: energy transducer TonB [Rhizomicrobium sp.]